MNNKDFKSYKNNIFYSLNQVENFLNCVTVFFKTKGFTEFLRRHLN